MITKILLVKVSKMSEEKKSKVRENLDNVFAALALTLGFLVVLMLIFQVSIALF
jgi:hypothetical protein